MRACVCVCVSVCLCVAGQAALPVTGFQIRQDLLWVSQPLHEGQTLYVSTTTLIGKMTETNATLRV